MCPHCVAVGVAAVALSLPFVRPTVNHYRAKWKAKKEKQDAPREEG